MASLTTTKEHPMARAVEKQPVNIHMDKPLHAKLQEFKNKTGMSYNEFFRRVATKALEDFNAQGILPCSTTL
jgi:hypothetical protein